MMKGRRFAKLFVLAAIAVVAVLAWVLPGKLRHRAERAVWLAGQEPTPELSFDGASAEVASLSNPAGTKVLRVRPASGGPATVRVAPSRAFPGDSLLIFKTRLWAQRTVPFTVTLRSPEGLATTKGYAFPDWQQLAFAFAIRRPLDASQAVLTVTFPQATEFRLAGLAVDVQPHPPIREPGSPEPAWRQAAKARIERYRKGPLQIAVVDANGRPIPDATVAIDQQQHAFRFGTAGSADLLLKKNFEGERYRTYLKRLFNTFVFENDLKWENQTPETESKVNRAIGWLRDNDFRVRGHNLVWGNFSHLPPGLKDESVATIRDTLRKRVQDTMRQYRGKIDTWDVVNEAATNHELWDLIGEDAFADCYRWARAADPKAMLAYNDHSVTEEASDGADRRDEVLGRVETLLHDHAPLDVIGLECHVSAPLTPIPRVLEILNEVAKYHQAIQITEFDLGLIDEAQQASYLGDFMTAAFSEPSVDGFVMWGFWAGAHWRAAEGAGLLRPDWSPKPSLDAYRELVQKEWSTHARAQTGPAGRVSMRAFYGLYRITVEKGGRSVTETVRMPVGQTTRVTIRIR